MTTSCGLTATEREWYEASLRAVDARAIRLRLALEAVLDAHSDCDDGTGTICGACASAMAELRRVPPSTPPEVKP